VPPIPPRRAIPGPPRRLLASWRLLEELLMLDQTARTAPVVLFLHIPKTAGTTFGNVFSYQYCSFDPAEKADPDPEVRLYDGTYWPPFHTFDTQFPPYKTYGSHGEPQSHVRDVRFTEHVMTTRRNRIRAVIGHFPFGIHELLLKPSTYITFLRDPIDRVISLYYFALKYSNNPYHERLVAHDISLEEFVAGISCREAENDQTRRLSGLNPDFGACTVDMLRTAKDNMTRSFSVVGITERFDESLLLFKRTLGWTRSIRYWPGQVNDTRPRKESISQATKDLIAKYNQLDIELYDYARTMLDKLIVNQDSTFSEELRAFKADQSEFMAGHRGQR
jgi:hypothetical protein